MNQTATDKQLIHHFLENAAESDPHKCAVIHGNHSVTYDELNKTADSIASCLLDTGIKKGDRIALLIENSVDYIAAYYAILKAGAVVAPFNPGLKPTGLEYLLRDLAPACIITTFKSEPLLKSTDLGNIGLKLLIVKNPKKKWTNTVFRTLPLEDAQKYTVKTASHQTAPDELSSIIYTSGSTGKPKGVMLSHKNITSNTSAICQFLGIRNKDIQMIVLPFFYVMGKSLLNTHIASGATVVLNNSFMYPAGVINQMVKEKVTSFAGVPSTYAYLLNRSPLSNCKDKLQHLRYCSQAGGHMDKATKLALKEALPDHTKIVIMYGATEAAARLTCLDYDFYESKIGSIGKPIKGVSIRLLDAQDTEVPDGHEGELVASGPNIMKGYWKAHKLTAQVLNSHGYHTGDIGYRDKDGFLYVKGRKDGLLKIGGHRVNPTEIEDFLMSSDVVIEVAVLGVPDDLLGKKLVAIAVPKHETASQTILMEKCRGGLPAHKRPSTILTMRSLPKNANGKIDYQKCFAHVTKEFNKGAFGQSDGPRASNEK